MSSLTLVNGNHNDTLAPGSTTTCYLVTASTTAGVIMPQQTASTTVARLAPKRPQLLAEDEDSSDLLRCKRRIHFGQLNYGQTPQQPTAVARRNERERNRVRLVNLGFATLRQHVPHGTKNKKMSKVDTLRSAVEYIKQLQHLLNEQDSSPSTSSDENSYPSSSYPTSSSSATAMSITSPACSGASSPTPSVCSDASSPYDILNGDEEDLMDFATWF